MDSDDETILSKMDEHQIGEIGTLDQSGVGTDVPLLDTSVKQEVESDDEFRRVLKNTTIPSLSLVTILFINKIASYKTEISEIQLDNIIGGEEVDESAVLLEVDDDDVDFDEVDEVRDDDEVAIKQEPSDNFVDEAYEEIQMEEEQFQESPEDANLTDKVCFWWITTLGCAETNHA